jgi:hypothetical protein
MDGFPVPDQGVKGRVTAPFTGKGEFFALVQMRLHVHQFVGLVAIRAVHEPMRAFLFPVPQEVRLFAKQMAAVAFDEAFFAGAFQMA